MSDDMKNIKGSSAGEQGVLRSMQEVAMNDQDASRMLRTYNIARWGNNYYDVNELGHISVCPDPDQPEVRVDRRSWLKSARPTASACLRCSASRKFCSTVCVRLMPPLNARVNPTAIRATTSGLPDQS